MDHLAIVDAIWQAQIGNIPHPVYAWMGWISVLNPSDKTFEKLKPFIQESYEYAVEKFKKRKI